MGVITMKMISSTNITSTMGVTLMSELTLAPSFRLANDIISPKGSGQLHLPVAGKTSREAKSIPPRLGKPDAGNRPGAGQQLTADHQTKNSEIP
jgi:hypothetical protein